MRANPYFLPRMEGCQNAARRSSATSTAYTTEPVTAATATAAHTRPIFMRVASVEMRKPRPEVGEPKNSATMAPIKASVAFTLSAENKNGMAAGKRSDHSVRP